MNTPTKMNLEEYKKYFFNSNYYKSLSKFLRFLDLIRVRVWKFEDKNDSSIWTYQRRLNPYNPLTYVAIFVMIVSIGLTSIVNFFKRDIPDVLSNIFKYN